MKTLDMIGPALDWAVAKCEGNVDWEIYRRMYGCPEHGTSYSTDWAQGGPIIEREKLCILPAYKGLDGWRAESQLVFSNGAGPTPLIAAMRCYVASKLGDTVDVPEELQNV
jgi:hypothetical protein